MKHRFDFIKPATLQEALDLLADGDPAIRPLAGGTDIIAGLHQDAPRFTAIKKLVDIHGLPELTAIRETEDGISIGTAATFSDIQNKPVIKEKYPVLAKAVSTIGSLQIRNRATIGGNFVNNAPCADSVPPLLVYDAQLNIRSKRATRSLLLKDFLTSPYRTQLQPEELITEITLPPVLDGFSGDFYKLGRRRGVAISRITLAVLAKMEGQVIREMRIAAGAVTPIGVHFPELEKMAAGKTADPDFLKSLSQELGRQVLNKTGLRWSTPYKLPVTQQMFYQLLCGICRGKGEGMRV